LLPCSAGNRNRCRPCLHKPVMNNKVFNYSHTFLAAQDFFRISFFKAIPCKG
jgi:hypothetical protein